MDLNIRNFPDELHRTLKSEAALQGITLRDFFIKNCERIAYFWKHGKLKDEVKNNPAD